MAYFYKYVYYGSSRNDGTDEPLLSGNEIPLSERQAGEEENEEREEETEEPLDVKESEEIKENK